MQRQPTHARVSAAFFALIWKFGIVSVRYGRGHQPAAACVDWTTGTTRTTSSSDERTGMRIVFFVPPLRGAVAIYRMQTHVLSILRFRRLMALPPWAMASHLVRMVRQDLFRIVSEKQKNRSEKSKMP